MQVRWLPEAIDDVREIRDYIAKDNPTAAEELALHFEKAELQLEEFPKTASEGKIPGTRELDTVS